jgi:RNA polymerase sigma factor (sigma-70 family)
VNATQRKELLPALAWGDNRLSPCRDMVVAITPTSGRRTQQEKIEVRFALLLSTDLARGAQMYSESFTTAPPIAGLDSLVVTCCPVTTAVTTSVAMRGDWPIFRFEEVVPVLSSMAPPPPPPAPETRLRPIELQTSRNGRHYVVTFVVRTGPPMPDQLLSSANASACCRVVRCCSGDYLDVALETVFHPGIKIPTVVRSAIGCCNPAGVTSVFGLDGRLWMVSLLQSLDSDAALLFEVRSFLACKAIGSPIPPPLQHAWNVFYWRYESLVRREARRSCRFALSGHELDDLIQEIWRTIVAQLPRLAYDRARGDLFCWLAGLTRRKVRHLARRLVPSWAECSVPIDVLAGFLPSPVPGPEEASSIGELWEQLGAALDRLRKRTSPKTYDVFCRRFIDGQTNVQVAADLGLSPKAVQLRYDRAMRKWQKLAGDLGIPGCGGEFMPPRNPPLTMKPR